MLISSLLAAAFLTTAQPHPGSVADQATRPLWAVVNDAQTLAAVDIPPATEESEGTVDVSFWVFQPMEDGYDTIVASMTVDCPARTFVHHNFSAFSGARYVGTTVATETAPEAAEDGTFYDYLVRYVCDPVEGEPRAADFADHRAAHLAFNAEPATD